MASTSHAPSRDGIIRHGFGLKAEIKADLNADYHSDLIQTIRNEGNRMEAGGLRLRLAAAFGFCYGVDKAIDFAYETRRQFPDRRIFLTNEIIHNPRVNNRLLEMGIRILSGQYAAGISIEQITPDDVVLLPAFGIDHVLLQQLRQIGCVLVDTTCGSVVHVWKRVERYAIDGYTAIIHGKWSHEETIATCSQVTKYPGGHYLVLRDREQAAEVCDYIRTGAGEEKLAAQFKDSFSPGFDFPRDLARVGIANQTTMLSSESLEIAGMFRQAMIDRYGEATIAEHFRSFDTICGATQERQDAVLEMMKQPPDLMLVIGGFNSSNTTHLCEITVGYCPTFHIDEVDCLISPTTIRHQPPQPGVPPIETQDWLPTRRPLEIGLTAGASTPNRVIGEVIERLVEWEKVVSA